MSQLIGYTRKILASAISSIADELEQTVLDFNDAIQVLSSQQSANQDNPSQRQPTTTSCCEPTATSHLGLAATTAVGKEPTSAAHQPTSAVHQPKSEANQPTSAANQPTSAVHQPKSAANQPTSAAHQPTSAVHQPMTNFPSPTLQGPIHQEVPIYRSHSVATTRQPEAIGFSPILNVQLSRSSPSLLPEVSLRLASHRQQEPSCSPARPGVTNSPSLESVRSSLSQSLVHIPTPARSNHTQALDSARHGVSISSSPVSEVITRGAPSIEGDEVTAPCNRIPSIKVLTRIGQKRPGKVVRSQCLSQIGHPETKLNQLSSDKVDTGTQTETDPESALVLASSHETEARLTRWFSLRPFSQVLSFAFSQFANIVLMFSEEPQSPDTTGPRSHRRQLSITFDNAERNQETYPDTTASDSYSVITFGIAKEPTSLESPMMSSVYSCESFEVIESSSNERRSCSPQDVVDSPCDGSFLSRLYSDTNATQTEETHSSVKEFHGCKVADPMSASAEFFQFDFKELVSNRQFNKLNPLGVVSGNTSEFSDERFSSDVKTTSMEVDSQVTDGKAGSYYVETTLKSQARDEMEEKDCNNGDDDDDDGSASFTVLSENGEDEFIVL